MGRSTPQRNPITAPAFSALCALARQHPHGALRVRPGTPISAYPNRPVKPSMSRIRRQWLHALDSTMQSFPTATCRPPIDRLPSHPRGHSITSKAFLPPQEIPGPNRKASSHPLRPESTSPTFDVMRNGLRLPKKSSSPSFKSATLRNLKRRMLTN